MQSFVLHFRLLLNPDIIHFKDVRLTAKPIISNLTLHFTYAILHVLFQHESNKSPTLLLFIVLK